MVPIIEDLMNRLDFLNRIDHGKWHAWPIAGISTSWIGGMWAQVDGTHIVNLIALCILAVGSAVMGIISRYQGIEARRAMEQARVKAQEAEDAAQLERKRKLYEIEVDEARRASYNRVPQITVVHPAEALPITPPVVEHPKEPRS